MATTVLPAIGRVDVYPVGLLFDLQRAVNAVRAGHPRHARFLLRQAVRHWRRRSYWNGYLAEPYVMPVGVYSCGRGWTQAAARRSLLRLVDAGRIDAGRPGLGELWLTREDA